MLLCGTTAHADNVSFAYYGIQSPKWNCDASLKALKALGKPVGVSLIYNTFGTDFACAKKLVDAGVISIIEVHLINEVCLRNGRCGPYEYLAGKTVRSYEQEWANPTAQTRRKLRDYSKPVVDFLGALPASTACVVNGGLESNLTTRAGKNLIAEAQAIFPRCRVTWNPMRGSPIPGTVFQLHGSKQPLKSPCIANLDGEDINFPDRHSELPNKLQSSDIPKYLASYAQCEAANLWVLEFNGNCQGKNLPFVDPRKRSCWPDKAMFDRVAALAKAQPYKPPTVPPWDTQAALSEVGCKQVIKKPADGEKRGFLVKESDTKKTTAGKLALITMFPDQYKTRFRNVEILRNGRSIERFSYVYQYTQDGGDRQVWQSNRAPADYPYNVVLKADGICWRLRNPRERID